MLFILFFMNLKLSDSIIYYHCPIIKEPIEKTALNLTDEEFFIYNISLLVIQTLNYFIKSRKSSLDENYSRKSYGDILLESYNSLLKKYDNNITEKELKVKTIEERITKEFTNYWASEKIFFSEYDNNNSIVYEVNKKMILKKRLQVFCRKISKDFIKIYEKEEEMWNWVLKFNIKTFLNFVENKLISVKQEIIVIKQEFCENKDLLITDLSKVKKTDTIYLNFDLCSNQLATNGSDTDFKSKNFRDYISNFYAKMFFYIDKLNTTGNLYLKDRKFDFLCAQNFLIKNISTDNIYNFETINIIYTEKPKKYLEFLVKGILYLHRYVKFLCHNKNFQKNCKEFENIINLIVFFYEKDLKIYDEYYENYKKYKEHNDSWFDQNFNKFAIAEYDKVSTLYFYEKFLMKNMSIYLQMYENQNSDNRFVSEQYNREMLLFLFQNKISNGKNYKKNKNKRRNKSEKKKNNNNLIDCSDSINSFKNDKLDTESKNLNGENEQKCIIKEDLSNQYDEKSLKENESILVIDNNEKEVKKINGDQIFLENDLDLKFPQLDISKQTTISKKTKNDNKMNIDEKENNKFKDTFKRKNSKKQELTDNLQESIQKGKEQEKKDSSENNSSNSTISKIDSLNTKFGNLQMKNEFKDLKQEKNNAKQNISDSNTSSIGSKSTFAQDFKHPTKKNKKKSCYIQQSDKISSKDKSNLNLSKDVLKYKKTRISQSEFSDNDKHQTDTIKKEEEYHKQNDNMKLGNCDKPYYITQKIEFFDENMLDQDTFVKKSVKSSEVQKQEIPPTLISKNENPEVVEGENIPPIVDQEYEDALFAWLN